MPIRNPVAFIGEAVLGAVPGVPLVADANGLLASGLSVIEVSDSSNATTTSATDALLTTMTITASPGTYLVLFSTSITSNNAGAAVTVSLYNNGVQVPTTVIKISPFDGGTLSATTARGAVSINKVVTITTGALTVEWSTSGGTATCGPRVLNMLRTS